MSDVLVLCYHAVSPTWPAALSVTPELLERQLDRMVRNGWRSATFTEAVHDPPHEKTLVLTFDDAFASVDELAVPILRSLGLTATIFVPSYYISEGRDLAWPGTQHWLQTLHAQELAPMSWQRLGELAQEGWEIGSHTHTHPRLPNVDDATLREELAVSREECERQLGIPCLSLAYPFGESDQRVEDFAGEAGYQCAATLTSHLDAPHPLGWPRIGIYHRDQDLRFALKTSRRVRRLRHSPLWYERG